MNKITTIIVDDEPLAREKIRNSLESERDIEIVSECTNGKTAVSEIRKLNPDLVFLDVQMPKCDGFEVIRQVGADNMPAVIFVTAFDKYALKAFETHALDYLLKPYDRKRFKKSVKRVIKQIVSNRSLELNQKLLSLIGDEGSIRKRYLDRIAVHVDRKFIFLNVDKIDWIEASGNYIYLNVKSESHLVRDSMNGIESRLNPDKFIRIHRSYIVNVDRIKAIQPQFKGAYVLQLKDGTELVSSRKYRQTLNALLSP